MYIKRNITYRGWTVIQYSSKDNEDEVFYRIPPSTHIKNIEGECLVPLKDDKKEVFYRIPMDHIEYIECECWVDVMEYIDSIIDGGK